MGKKTVVAVTMLTLLTVSALAALTWFAFSLNSKPEPVKTVTKYVMVKTPCWEAELLTQFKETLTEEAFQNCGTVTDVWAAVPYEQKTVNTVTSESGLKEGFYITPITVKSLNEEKIVDISNLVNYEIVKDIPTVEPTKPPVNTSMNGLPPAGVTPTAEPTPTLTPTPQPTVVEDKVFEVFIDNQYAIEITYTSNTWKHRTKTMVLVPEGKNYVNSAGERVGAFIIDYVSNEDNPTPAYNQFINSWKWVKQK